MTYSDLLRTSEWKEKREEILERDNNECKRCGASYNEKMVTSAFLVSAEELKVFNNIEIFNPLNFNIKLLRAIDMNDNPILLKSDIDEIEYNDTIDYIMTVNFRKKEHNNYPFSGSTDPKMHDNIFLKIDCNVLLHSLVKEKLRSNNNYSVDKEGFWFAQSDDLDEYSKNFTIFHVHHKCYRKNKQIWEQNNNEYMTLCNVCHKIIHNNEKIPYYDEGDKIISYLNNCSRCGGTGYLECYKHVQNGRCFKCDGAGYI